MNFSLSDMSYLINLFGLTFILQLSDIAAFSVLLFQPLLFLLALIFLLKDKVAVELLIVIVQASSRPQSWGYPPVQSLHGPTDEIGRDTPAASQQIFILVLRAETDRPLDETRIIPHDTIPA